MKPGSVIIAKILTLCGISLSCTACYGIPQSEYHEVIEGTVVSESTGKPISGIRVSVKPTAGEYETGEATTDGNGLYTLSFRDGRSAGPEEDRVDVTAEDIDGAANGGEFIGVTKNIPIDPDEDRPRGSVTVDFRLKTKQ